MIKWLLMKCKLKCCKGNGWTASNVDQLIVEMRLKDRNVYCVNCFFCGCGICLFTKCCLGMSHHCALVVTSWRMSLRWPTLPIRIGVSLGYHPRFVTVATLAVELDWMKVEIGEKQNHFPNMVMKDFDRAEIGPSLHHRRRVPTRSMKLELEMSWMACSALTRVNESQSLKNRLNYRRGWCGAGGAVGGAAAGRVRCCCLGENTNLADETLHLLLLLSVSHLRHDPRTSSSTRTAPADHAALGIHLNKMR